MVLNWSQSEKPTKIISQTWLALVLKKQDFLHFGHYLDWDNFKDLHMKCTFQLQLQCTKYERLLKTTKKQAQKHLAWVFEKLLLIKNRKILLQFLKKNGETDIRRWLAPIFQQKYYVVFSLCFRFFDKWEMQVSF